MALMNDWSNWVILGIVSLAVYSFVEGFNDFDKYQDGKMTLAVIERTYIASDSRFINYKYIVEGEPYYFDTSSWSTGLSKEGQYFYVIYVEDNPQDHLRLFTREVKNPQGLDVIINDITISNKELYRNILGF